MTVFGRIIDGSAVEAAAESTLQTWMPTYLAEMERQTGRDPGSLPQIRSWTRTNNFDGRFPEDQIPLVLLISPGLAGSPVKSGSGVYRASFALGVAVVVSARTRPESNSLAKIYAAAIRAALLQRRSLGGFARGTVWVDERYDDLEVEGQRSLAAARLMFEVEVDEVVSQKAGPAAPDPQVPPAEWPTVNTVDTELRKEPV